MKAELEGQLTEATAERDSTEPFLGKGIRGIRRRDFVKAFVAATVAPAAFLGQATPPPRPATLPAPAPVPWMMGLNPATPVPAAEVADAVAEGELHFFTSAQMGTLSRFSDLLVPAIAGTPGAVAAGAPVFLDFLIGESPSDRKALYQGGLDWLDAESKKEFGKPFAALDKAQADRLIKPWLRTWMSDHPPTEQHAAFINTAHADIRTATVNSKEWSDATKQGSGQESTPKGLYWYPVDPDMHWNRAGANHDTAR